MFCKLLVIEEEDFFLIDDIILTCTTPQYALLSLDTLDFFIDINFLWVILNI
jgi:hypothetical protein